MPRGTARPRGVPLRGGIRAGRAGRDARVRLEKLLYIASDHGHPVTLRSHRFAPPVRDGGWGPFAESFERANRAALSALDVGIEYGSGSDGVVIRLVPGGRAGAVPLRSAQTGHVAGGLVVRPRFGWPGVGRVLSETGWHAAPEFLEMPLVPGSGREVPPWVLAGPLITRLAALLHALRKDYRDAEAVLQRPRGRILWDRYRAESLVRGRWDRLPCRFPDLDVDPLLRREIRWALERIHRDLMLVGGRDPIAMGLASVAARLLDELAGVLPAPPRRSDLERRLVGGRAMAEVLRRGLEALGWIVDERGLGGGRQSDGLAWSLPLERLWESYVESVIRKEASMIGGGVRVGRLAQTTVRLDWSDPAHRTLGHLVPDFVVHRGRSIQVVDAKYKAHLAEVDEHGWRRFEAESRAEHRADLHQVLAYASVFEADEVTATLVYPLRLTTWRALRSRERDTSRAELFTGGRLLRLELRGLPFGHGHIDPDVS